MVRAACELESEHGRHGRRGRGHNGDGVERQCGAGGADEVSGAGALLSQSVVSIFGVVSGWDSWLMGV